MMDRTERRLIDANLAIKKLEYIRAKRRAAGGLDELDEILYEHEIKLFDACESVDPESLPIVKQLRDEIRKLNEEIASREEAGIREHNDLHYWRDLARKYEQML